MKLNYGFTLDVELGEKLNDEAESNDRSRSSMLNVILKERYNVEKVKAKKN